MTDQELMEAGMRCYLHNRPYDVNPWRYGTKYWKLWAAGWLLAQKGKEGTDE